MLSWTVIVDVVVITALAAGAVERFAGAHPPHYRGFPLLDLHRNFNMELRCSFVVYLWN